MCHVTSVKEQLEFIDIEVLERNTVGLESLHVIIGSEYEPTIHPQFERLLRLCIRRNWKVDFLTNGKAIDKIDKKLWEDVQFHVLNFSFDGFSKASYERIRKGANYGKIKKNIEIYSQLAKRNGTFTAINATMLRSNLDETLVRLLVMQIRSPDPSILSESLFPVHRLLQERLSEAASLIADDQMRIGVRNGYYASPDFNVPDGVTVENATIFSNNPLVRQVPGVRQIFQKGKHSFSDFPCKSPLVYARIRWDGSVDFCNNRNFVIGNIYHAPFISIWSNDEAESLRQKIFASTGKCETCDYFRFCINFQSLNIAKAEAHIGHELLSDRKLRNLFYNKNF